jgi:hypothetical protein
MVTGDCGHFSENQKSEGHMPKKSTLIYIFILICLLNIPACLQTQNTEKLPVKTENQNQTQGLTTTPKLHLQTPTLTPVRTATPTIKPTRTVTRTITPTPKGYADLPDGDYILFVKSNVLRIISIDGQINEKIIEIENMRPYLSPDNRHLLLIPEGDWLVPELLDLQTMSREELPFLQDCYDAVLSKDNHYFLGSCKQGQYQYHEIFLFSRDGAKKIQMTNCSDSRGECSNMAFSPDGKWITYRWGLNGSGQSDKIGLYISPFVCPELEQACQLKASGPVLKNYFKYKWAKNSKSIITYWDDALIFYQRSGENFYKTREIKLKELIRDNYILSPDSNKIAFLEQGIKIKDLQNAQSDDEKITSFPDYLIDWITIKNGKASN